MKASKRQSLLPAPKSVAHRSSATTSASSASWAGNPCENLSPIVCTGITLSHATVPHGPSSHTSLQLSGKNTSNVPSKLKAIPNKTKAKGHERNSIDLNCLHEPSVASETLQSSQNVVESGDTVGDGENPISGKQFKNLPCGLAVGKPTGLRPTTVNSRKIDASTTGLVLEHMTSKESVTDAQKANEMIEDELSCSRVVPSSLSTDAVNRNQYTTSRLSNMLRPAKPSLLKRGANNTRALKPFPVTSSSSETDYRESGRLKCSPTNTSQGVTNKASVETNRKIDLHLNDAGVLHSLAKLESSSILGLQAYDLEYYGNAYCASKKFVEPTDSSMSSPFGSTRAMPDLIAPSSNHSSRKSRIGSFDSCGNLDVDHLASSDGSLGILDDTDLLNSSLLATAFKAEASNPSSVVGLGQQSTILAESECTLQPLDHVEDSFESLTNKIASLSVKMNDIPSNTISSSPGQSASSLMHEKLVLSNPETNHADGVMYEPVVADIAVSSNPECEMMLEMFSDLSVLRLTDGSEETCGSTDARLPQLVMLSADEIPADVDCAFRHIEQACGDCGETCSPEPPPEMQDANENSGRLTPVNEMIEDISEVTIMLTEKADDTKPVDPIISVGVDERSSEDVGHSALVESSVVTDAEKVVVDESELSVPAYKQCVPMESEACTSIDLSAECITSSPKAVSGANCENATCAEVDKATLLELSDVKTTSKLRTTSKKDATKSDSKVKDVSARSVSARLATPSERRPSAPAVMRDASSTVRQPRKNSMLAGATSQLQSTVTSSISLSKQPAQLVKSGRGSIDLGRSMPPLGTKTAKSSVSESTRPQVLRSKPGTSFNGGTTVRPIASSQCQLSTSRQSMHSNQGNRTPSGSHLNISSISTSIRTSSPLPGVGVTDIYSRTSDDSSLSQPGSVSDLSSLDASHNSSGALSGCIPNLHLSTASSVKSSATEPSATRSRNSNNILSASLRSTTNRGSLSSRSSGPSPPDPATTRKASLTDKRASVIEMNAKPVLHGTRRTSVTSQLTSVSRTTPVVSRAIPAVSATSKSKTSNANTSSEKPVSGQMKQSHRPDVVSSLVIDERSASEIARLEVLCEAKTKQVSELKCELSERIRWFEAMALVVKFFVAQLECRVCERLTKRLQEASEQLNTTGRHLEELTRQRDALIDEIQNVKQREEQERDTLKTVHQEELRLREIELEEKSDQDLRRVNDDHAQKVADLETTFSEQFKSLRQSCDQELASKEADFNDQLMELKIEQENSLAELQGQHESQLEEITQRFELIKVALSEKAEFLHTEGEELRRREKTYMETCQRECELRIQSALSSFSHLPQEIDSLKAVIELKNNELHELRQQNRDLQREMEELPISRDTIKRLQQKVENSEAIISIRADYEKQVTEKYQQLLRKYEQESKANKRLSMDKEQLMWRLAQGDVIPEPSRRSLSHSPTAVIDQPPNFTRSISTAKSPSISERPAYSNNATNVCSVTSGGTDSVKLRRSGTYDLLNKTEADEVFD